MRSIREEIQTWLELVARTVNNIPFDKEVDWFDIVMQKHQHTERTMGSS
jgi:hypothetical protein